MGARATRGRADWPCNGSPGGASCWTRRPGDRGARAADAERAAISDAQAVTADRVTHPVGPVARITATVAGDDGAMLVDRWLFRSGSLAYQLLGIANADGPDYRPVFGTIAASFVPPG